MIGGGAQGRIGARGLLVMHLFPDRCQVPLMFRRHLTPRRLRGDAAVAAVEAHAVDRDVVDYGTVVDVGDPDVVRNIVDAAVVEKRAAPPFATLIAMAAIAVAIIDAAIEADVGTPVAAVPEIGAIEEAPVARRPQVAGAGHGRLLVNRQFGRRDVDRYADVHGSGCRGAD